MCRLWINNQYHEYYCSDSSISQNSTVFTLFPQQVVECYLPINSRPDSRASLSDRKTVTSASKFTGQVKVSRGKNPWAILDFNFNNTVTLRGTNAKMTSWLTKGRWQRQPRLPAKHCWRQVAPWDVSTGGKLLITLARLAFFAGWFRGSIKYSCYATGTEFDLIERSDVSW